MLACQLTNRTNGEKMKAIDKPKRSSTKKYITENFAFVQGKFMSIWDAKVDEETIALFKALPRSEKINVMTEWLIDVVKK